MLFTAIDHGAYDFKLLRFQVQERISAPYQLVVDVVSQDPYLDLQALAGKPYCLTLLNEYDEVERYFPGRRHVSQKSQRFTRQQR